MLTIYALAALPFFTGGLVVTLTSMLSARVNSVRASDLIGAAIASGAHPAARSRRRAGRPC
jgi:hypothetical protein